MRAALGTRVARLEKASSAGQARVLEMVYKQALQVISDQELERLCDFVKRGAPFSECTAGENPASERYRAESHRTVVLEASR